MPFYDVALFATTNKSIYNKPYVLRLDGIYIDKLNTIKNSEIENKKIFDSIKNSSGVIFNSQYSKKIVETLYQKIDKPNTIIANGVDQSLFKPDGENLRQKFGIEEDEIVLITCAFWRRHKRLKETIIFFNKLIKKRKEKFRLIIIGSDKIDHTEKDERIIFSGLVDNNDLPKWYRTANIYIHLSWIEANANSQCEAISCGLPVLCSNNGGNYESVINLNSGIVSNCDENFNYKMVDLYNPPEPDYNILMEDLDKLINDKRDFKSNELIKKIDLDRISNEYLEFIIKTHQSK